MYDYCNVCHAHTNQITGRTPHSVHCPLATVHDEVDAHGVTAAQADHAAYVAYWTARGSRA